MHNLLLKNGFGRSSSALISNTRTEAVSDNVNFEVIFYTYPEGVLMNILHAEFHIPVSNVSLIIATKQKVQETFPTVTIFLFKKLHHGLLSSEVYFYILFPDRKLK